MQKVEQFASCLLLSRIFIWRCLDSLIQLSNLHSKALGNISNFIHNIAQLMHLKLCTSSWYNYTCNHMHLRNWNACNSATFNLNCWMGEQCSYSVIFGSSLVDIVLDTASSSVVLGHASIYLFKSTYFVLGMEGGRRCHGCQISLSAYSTYSIMYETSNSRLVFL